MTSADVIKSAVEDGIPCERTVRLIEVYSLIAAQLTYWLRTITKSGHCNDQIALVELGHDSTGNRYLISFLFPSPVAFPFPPNLWGPPLRPSSMSGQVLRTPPTGVVKIKVESVVEASV